MVSRWRRLQGALRSERLISRPEVSRLSLSLKTINQYEPIITGTCLNRWYFIYTLSDNIMMTSLNRVPLDEYHEFMFFSSENPRLKSQCK